jgi:hypothetical protein
MGVLLEEVMGNNVALGLLADAIAHFLRGLSRPGQTVE